ncbi:MULTISPECIES: PIN domain-containing protein [Methylocaldum]|jgi:predicted nucleic acid-binding protein|uniref:type II toxin-antitoxin system VapC family toxin n=1 Tax=unclassified Methylocaldum TaxID=2622260 RepID=UPI00105ECAE4
MNLYLDSSAWVKLYVAEPGQPEFIRMASTAVLLISHLIAYVEVHAAFAKRWRMGDIKDIDYDQCLAQFQSDWADALIVQVDEPLAQSAAEMAFTYGLRGYDSVHLAAAHFFHQHSGEPLHFACFDKRLNAAAKSLGLHLLI